ncbi:hypothetical protein ACIBIZ_38100 [Nonomuraea spiralis]|nr:hypothetical protein [Nonomuraea sp. WAC 01424]
MDRTVVPITSRNKPANPIDLADHRVHRRAILAGRINEYRIAS